jgi:hypothetical protein
MNHVKVYFQESSIHGFPYIVNSNLHIIEKFLWIVALLISFISCGMLIFEIGMKVQEDTLVTYTSDTAIDVTNVSWQTFSRILIICYLEPKIRFPKISCSQIPFTGVTFCPEIRISNEDFDYNQIMTSLKGNAITINNLTSEEFVTGST